MLIFRPFGCLARINQKNFKRLDLFFTRSRWSNRNRSGRLQPRVKWTPAYAAPTPFKNGRLLGPALFSFGFAGSCYTMCSIWEYENLRSMVLNLKQRTVDWIHRQLAGQKHGDLRTHLNNWWRCLTSEQKLYYAILLANATVFLAWRMPSLQHFMITYFTLTPFARVVCWPMVSSTFSHYSAIRFGMNMYVLHSAMDAIAPTMGKEQFLAFYLSAGVFSSLASHIYKTLIRAPGVSLGASGAIMGLLGYFCSKHPNGVLQDVLVPALSFTASTGLKVFMCVDTVALIMRWRVFDHAAQLGGALFGLFWFHWGQKHLWGEREGLVRRWHDLRSKIDVGK